MILSLHTLSLVDQLTRILQIILVYIVLQIDCNIFLGSIKNSKKFHKKHRNHTTVVVHVLEYDRCHVMQTIVRQKPIPQIQALYSQKPTLFVRIQKHTIILIISKLYFHCKYVDDYSPYTNKTGYYRQAQKLYTHFNV